MFTSILFMSKCISDMSVFKTNVNSVNINSESNKALILELKPKMES